MTTQAGAALFAFAGSAGSVMMFVSFGLLFIITSAYLAGLTARAYMVVAQGTAAGLDEVPWPDDAVVDWLPQAFMLLLTLAVWVVPAGFLARWLAPVFLPDDPALRATILVALAVWLLFPPGLLMMQRAGAAWTLLRRFPAVLMFYLLTGLLLAALGAVVYLALAGASWALAAVAAVLGPAILLIHARLLGRLGLLIAQMDREEREPGKPRKARKGRKVKRARAEVIDPWAEPEPEPPEEEKPLYAFKEVTVEEKKPARPASEEEETDPYTLQGPGPEQPARTAPAVVFGRAEVEREKEMLERKELPAPASLFFSGVFDFPAQQASWKPMALLSAWSLAAVFLGRVTASLIPW